MTALRLLPTVQSGTSGGSKGGHGRDRREFFRFHNTESSHQVLGYWVAAEIKMSTSMKAIQGELEVSLRADTLTLEHLGTAEPFLDEGPTLSN